MKPRNCAALMIAAIVCLYASIAGAQTKPDFSGTWKMNREKSKFERGGPDAILIKIDHKEPAFAENWTVSTPDGERSLQAKYTTDGKETEQEVMGRVSKTSAKWEGDALVIESSDSPYVNFLVARPDNKDDPRVQKLARALTGPEVKALIESKYQGAVLPAF